ncbi:MAG TPA: chain length determinant protein EpsF [Methylotenera sp.]|nr:chain length determinant protein EpsF [Methylotenera sp.]
MSLFQFLLILKARFKIIVLTFAVVVATSLLVTLMLPKSYQATTSLLLNYKGVDSVTGVAMPAQLVPGYMATQVDIIRSRNIALKVVDKLGLVQDEQVKAQFQKAAHGEGDIRSWMADILLKKLTVTPSKESSVLEISYSAAEPEYTANVANAFANIYQSTSVQLKVEPAQKAAGYFGEQVKTLRDNLEAAQTRLSKYQQANGITNPEQNFDVESMRLNELSTQLSLAQSAAIEAQSRKNSAQKNAADSPDVALSPVIQNLKIEESKAQAKLAELSQNLGVNHPEYQSAQSELNKIKAQLHNEIQRVSNSISGSANINQQRESDLRVQVDLQKKKVLELNRLRDDMTVLQKDVEVAQKAMDAVTQRFSQTSIEAQSNQSDIAILNPATVPLYPSSPKVFVGFVLSIILGAILGMGLGLIAELLDRRIRSRDDIAGLLEVPVFAMIAAKPRNKLMKILPSQLHQRLTA